MGLRTPFYEVKIAGEDITPWVSSVTVVEDDRQADNVTITIPDPRMIYADALFEGSTVEIDMGYAESSQHALMLRAIVTKVDQTYPDNGIPSLTLKGEDKSILMGLKERKKVWRGLKLSEIVRKVSQPYRFGRVDVQLNKDPLIQAKPIHQDGKTDLAFLQELAETYYAKCFVELDAQDQEVLYFISERRIVQLLRPDKLILSYRMGSTSNLINFSPSFDSIYLDRLKEIADFDTKGKKVETQKKPSSQVVIWELDQARLAQANAQDAEKIKKLYNKGRPLKDQLQKELMTRQVKVGKVVHNRAEMEAIEDSLESRRLGMNASGSTFGNIWLRAKSTIIIAGVNERFNGEWYVPSVTHKIDSSGYRTDFKCTR